MEPILVLVRDLMFAGKVSGTARAAGVEFKMIRDPGTLSTSEPGRMLIVDLNLPGAIAAAAGWRAATGRPVVAFVAHTDQAAIEEARAAGIDRILTRGQFTAMLPELLKA